MFAETYMFRPMLCLTKHTCFGQCYVSANAAVAIIRLDTINMIHCTIQFIETCSLDTIYQRPSIIRSLRLYIQQATGICETVTAVYLLASKQTAVSLWLLYVQSWTPDDGRSLINCIQTTCFDKLYCTMYRIYRIQPDDGHSSIGRNIAVWIHVC